MKMKTVEMKMKQKFFKIKIKVQLLEVLGPGHGVLSIGDYCVKRCTSSPHSLVTQMVC